MSGEGASPTGLHTYRILDMYQDSTYDVVWVVQHVMVYRSAVRK